MRLRTILAAVVLMAAWFGAVGVAVPSNLPPGVTVLPSEPGNAVSIIEVQDSGRWLVQRMSDRAFLTPKVENDGKRAILDAPPGPYNVIQIPDDTKKPLVAFPFDHGGGAKPPDPPLPPDPPGPTPPDPPQPVGQKWQVAFFASGQSLDNLPFEQRAIMASVKLRQSLASKGHRFVGFLDPASCPTGTCNTPLSPWFQAVAGKEMPRVAICPINGGPIREFPLPADEASLWKLLEKGGL